MQVLEQTQYIQWQKVSLMFMSWWCWAWCQSLLISMTWTFKIFNCIEYLFAIFEETRLLRLFTIYDKSSFEILQKMISFTDKYFAALLECNNSDLHISFHTKNMKKTFSQDLDMRDHEDIEKRDQNDFIESIHHISKLDVWLMTKRKIDR